MSEREPQIGEVFRVYCRNLRVGVYTGDGWFLGIREKLGDRYLASERNVRLGHYEGEERDPENDRRIIKRAEWVDGSEPIARVPDEISLEERGASICTNCGQPARWTGPPAPAPWECDGGCDEPAPAALPNRELTEFLAGIERDLGIGELYAS